MSTPTPETEFAIKKQIAREIDEALRRAYPNERFGVIAIWIRPGGEKGQGILDFTTNIRDPAAIANSLRIALAQILKGAVKKFHQIKVRD